MRTLPTIKKSFEVQFEYQLFFTNKLFTPSNTILKDVFKSFSEKPVKTLVVIDDGVERTREDLRKEIEWYAHKYERHIDLRQILSIEGGEKAKVETANLERILKAINDFGICRHSFVLAIGGGAVIDTAGYAAAIAHRGVKLIRIPTTVLAQNDAAVGVKNGINFFGKKNFLGSFAPPFAIINDYDFLQTLSQRDWIAGIAEAVKVSAIKDASFFGFLETNAKKMAARDEEVVNQMIHRCAELHMEHIANGGDPFESGSSRPLDFGHWAAHKLEQMTNFELRHGEAVAMGIALDLTYARLKGLTNETTLERVLKVLTDIGFDIKIPVTSKSEIEELLLGIEEFREHLGGQLTITLIQEIGQKYDVHEIDIGIMKKAITQRKTAKVVNL
ncbi:MAG: 3-dehydroquinate synthase [Bacteroidota bacterium]